MIASFVAAAVEPFMETFPKGFSDPKYLELERRYKVRAHEVWKENLNKRAFEELLDNEDFGTICRCARRVGGIGRALLHSSQQAALGDACRKQSDAKRFSEGLYSLTYGPGSFQKRFVAFAELLADLPQPGQKLTYWPVLTIFPFVAHPKQHIFIKPRTTRAFLKEIGLEDKYVPYQNWATYSLILTLAKDLKKHLEALGREELTPRDMIDIQSFIWVVEYPNYVKTY